MYSYGHGFQHIFSSIFQCKFLNSELNFIEIYSKGPINNIPSLIQVMALRLPGDTPLSEPVMFRLPTHVCHSVLMSY